VCVCKGKFNWTPLSWFKNDNANPTFRTFSPTPRMLLHAETITSIAPASFALPNNLNHVPPLEPIIPSNRVRTLDPRQLALLESIPLEKLLLLLPAEEDMFGYQLVLGNVDQQVTLQKDFDDARQHGGDDLHGGGGGVA